jgi:hypothetical protein
MTAAGEIDILDSECSVTPPNAFLEPVPLTLGPSQQQNDVRIAFFMAGGSTTNLMAMVPMHPDPPSTFTAGYSLNPGHECWGVYWRRLVNGDSDVSVAFPVPPAWSYFASAFMTARGVDPTSTPTGGRLNLTYITGATTATVSSVTVPSAGKVIFCIHSTADPWGGWPQAPSSLGCPTSGGWKNVVATDKSGNTYYPFDENPACLVIGNSYTTSGTTGAVSIPCTQGKPAFAGSYIFLKASSNVSATIGSF